MDERLRFIAAVTLEEHATSLAELCRRFGISRKTGYKWLERYHSGGPVGLQERLPVARSMPHRTPDAMVDAIVAARKEYPKWGPKKLRGVLMVRDPDARWPAASTIGDLFKRHGLIRPRRRRTRAPERRGPLDSFLAPNDIWCTDFKGHFAVGDGARCYPLTLTDGYSRYLLKCEGLVEPKGGPAKKHFELAFREFGLPLRIRSDNGQPFASTGAGGLTALSVWWLKLGIALERIDPGQPQQNGRHERMHRTLKLETPVEATMADQQRAFDRFRHTYNEIRPHEALEQTPPAKHYEPSKRPFPAEPRVPEYPDFDKTRWTNNSGLISWRGSRVLLTACLRMEPVGLRQVTETCWEVYYANCWLGILDDRDSKPRLRRQLPGKPEAPGVPDTASGGSGLCYQEDQSAEPELPDGGN